ncbi:hypothetical protein E3N88_20401 [Mikania micrantha]|uniref:Uncharacterized protein n=1 Tax=Mikania micrantha TaxID=192012 RepID=A0A5N6NJN7_9ASTR|nr:hypothetical protein E3N88_20401 [Mikania micrantha]
MRRSDGQLDHHQLPIHTASDHHQIDGVTDVLPPTPTPLVSPNLRLSARHRLAFDRHFQPQRHILLLLSLGQAPAPPRLEKLEMENESLPVVMPGDRIARFIALPCPCEPPRQEKVVVEQVHNTPKPPHVHVDVTLC